MTSKIKILVLIDYYIPGEKAGGPVRSLKNLVDHLGNDFDFKIITKDRDLGDISPYQEVKINDWNNNGKAQVYYISPMNKFFFKYFKLINSVDFDCIYLNSYFQPIFTILPLLASRFGFIKSKPIIIAPRGDLMEASMQIKKIKKNLFMMIARILNLYKNVLWQASNDIEAKSIKKYHPDSKNNIFIAQNLSPVKNTTNFKENHIQKKEGEIKICYLARISEEKNLQYALQILNKSVSHFIFDIYGPIENQKYWKECLSLIKANQKEKFITYKGPLNHNQVEKTLNQYDLFFLPTTGENYGHGIFEAMLCGTPVLIADTTPWLKLEERNIGWDFPLDQPISFIDTIKKISEMEENEYAIIRRNALEYAISISNNYETVKSNYDLFKRTIIHK
jgi:glycosyltransferase involved in cell wall biosynthesis